jgi:hypothetical protein
MQELLVALPSLALVLDAVQKVHVGKRMEFGSVTKMLIPYALVKVAGKKLFEYFLDTTESRAPEDFQRAHSPASGWLSAAFSASGSGSKTEDALALKPADPFMLVKGNLRVSEEKVMDRPCWAFNFESEKVSITVDRLALKLGRETEPFELGHTKIEANLFVSGLVDT